MGKIKYVLLTFMIISILMYGLIKVNIAVTEDINAGRQDEKNIGMDDFYNLDKAFLKIYKDEKNGYKFEFHEYIVYFEKDALKNLISNGTERD